MDQIGGLFGDFFKKDVFVFYEASLSVILWLL